MKIETNQEETVANTERKKYYKYKVTVQYSNDRNKMMKQILANDMNADFRIYDKWDFKVKTTLTSAQMARVLIYSGCESVQFRKCLCF